ncbi:MAG TPA: flavin reductase family protein [Syntrophorhabdaceae bacterium]|jgi:flavin reductase (DIM6/NTAB) family NADH-FMN oxidoreductase RutF
MKKSIGPNTLLYPTPSVVVGTYDKEGKANVMTAAWAGICCSEPPCIGISLRKATYTYGNIVERKAFTVCIASEKYVKEVDYFGIATGKKVDKLAVAGLTAAPSTAVDAPYVEEFPYALECALIHTIELGLHTQFIGRIVDVVAEESVLDAKGKIDPEKVRPLVFAPGFKQYYSLGRALGRAFSTGKDLL